MKICDKTLWCGILTSASRAVAIRERKAMAQKKKLQVKEERQAAVEAILTASHIPAGM